MAVRPGRRRGAGARHGRARASPAASNGRAMRRPTRSRRRSRRRRRRAVAPLRTVRLATDRGRGRREARRARPCGGAPSPAPRAELADAIAADLARLEPRHAPADRPSPATAPSWRPASTTAAARPACCWSPAAARPGSARTACTKGSPRRWRKKAIPASASTGAGSATAPARIRASAAAARTSPRPRPRFRARMPRASTRIVGFGLCDGATALALFGARGRARRR